MGASDSFLSSYAGLFYWVGVSSVAYFVWLLLQHVVYAVRLWVLGNPAAVGPHLGAWAGESTRPPPRRCPLARNSPVEASAASPRFPLSLPRRLSAQSGQCLPLLGLC